MYAFVFFSVSTTPSNQNLAVRLWLDIFLLASLRPSDRCDCGTRKTLPLLVSYQIEFFLKPITIPLLVVTFVAADNFAKNRYIST